jgi:phage-related protein
LRFFLEQQSDDVKKKINYVIFLIEHTDRVPEKFLKHIEGQKGLYEIRVGVGNNIFRIFCCFDKGRVVILFNGFQKKTMKTPKDEIVMAVKLMKQYFLENK